MGRMVWRGRAKSKSTGREVLSFPAKLYDFAPVSLGWAALRSGSEVHESPSVFCKPDTRRPTGLCFLIEGLSYLGGPPDVADGENIHLELTTLIGNLESVAHLNIPSGFHRVSIGFDAPEFACSGGKSARLEEPRRP